MRMQTRFRSSADQRTAFTLVELLVAAAMCMLIMAILSTAFSKSIDTFRYMRSVGNMQEQLRTAAIVMKRDLCSPHFGPPFPNNAGVPLGGINLSNQRQDLAGWTSPAQGYFTLTAGTSTQEPSGSPAFDGDGLPSYLGTGYQMGMTVILPGLTPQQQFYANAPTLSSLNPDYSAGGTILAAPTAQVLYFLGPQTSKTPSGTALYALYRQQQIVLATAPSSPPAGVLDVSSFSLADVATNVAGARLAATPFASGTNYYGTDLLLTNVISFEVKAHWWTAGLVENPTSIATSPDYPFAPLTYDSNVNTGVWIDALQIRIRIWDSKAEQARQITILQDM